MSGVTMNFSYTGPITAWNDFLSTSTISAPAAFTLASDLASCSSHFWRSKATDSLAAARIMSCSALGSLS